MGRRANYVRLVSSNEVSTISYHRAATFFLQYILDVYRENNIINNHKFRKQHLYKQEVETHLSLNKENIMILFCKYSDIDEQENNRYLTLPKFEKLCKDVPAMCFSTAKVRHAYTNSLELVIIDHDPHSRERYNKMIYTEFQEALCRVTLAIFQDTELEHLKFIEKLKLVLDNIFVLIDRKQKHILEMIDIGDDTSDH